MPITGPPLGGVNRPPRYAAAMVGRMMTARPGSSGPRLRPSVRAGLQANPALAPNMKAMSAMRGTFIAYVATTPKQPPRKMDATVSAAVRSIQREAEWLEERSGMGHQAWEVVVRSIVTWEQVAEAACSVIS